MEKAPTGEPIRYEGEYQDIDIKGWIRPHKPVRERVADLHRRDAGGDVPDGGRRRRRADRPPDVPAALARRGDGPELSRRAWRAPAGSAPRFDFIPTVTAARSTTTRPAPRRGPPDDRLLLDRPHLQARCGRCTASPTPPRRPATPSAGATSPPSREQIPDEMVEAYTAAGPLDKVRARVAEVGRARRRRLPDARRPTSSRPSRSASTRRRSSRRFGPA